MYVLGSLFVLLVAGWAIGALHAGSHTLAAWALRIPREATAEAPAVGALRRLARKLGTVAGHRLDDVPTGRRVLYLLAGPIGSMVAGWSVLALAHAVDLLLGEADRRSIVGHVSAGSPAAEAGIAPGDRVVAVDGVAIAWWSELAPALDRAGALTLTVERDGARREARLVVPESGVSGLSSASLQPIVGVDDPASDAGRAGLRTGDLVVSVDGRDVSDWPALAGALDAPGPHTLLVLGPGDRRVTLPEAPSTPRYGIAPIELFVGEVSGPAREAGLRDGDHVVRIDGVDIEAWPQLVARVQGAAEGRPLAVTVRRDGVEHTLEIEPSLHPEPLPDGRYSRRPRVGVAAWPDLFRPGPWDTRYAGLGEATMGGVARANEVVAFTIERLAGDFAPEVEVLGGPVAIYRETREAAPESFARRWFAILGMFVGIQSLMLGAYNLLPLHGSDMLDVADEMAGRIFGRRLPRTAIKVVGIGALVTLLVLVLAMDIRRAILD